MFILNSIPDIFSNFLQGIVTAPILFAMEEFPELRSVVDQGFEDSRNVDLVSFPSTYYQFMQVNNYRSWSESSRFSILSLI